MRDASTTCVAVLCGLPGAGKSALAQGWKDEDVHVASVDAAIGKRGGWDVAAWKPARRAVQREVREWLERNRDEQEEKHVIVVDDNMHLRSMRKEYFRIARERESTAEIQTDAESSRTRRPADENCWHRSIRSSLLLAGVRGCAVRGGVGTQSETRRRAKSARPCRAGHARAIRTAET